MDPKGEQRQGISAPKVRRHGDHLGATASEPPCARSIPTCTVDRSSCAHLGAATSRSPCGAPLSPRGWYALDALPHFDGGAIPQTLTFRLDGSIPRALIDRWEKELARHDPDDARDVHRRRVEAYLDRRLDVRTLERPDIAELVVEALLHFDGDRYTLHAWVVMPNHVHVVLTPREGIALYAIVKSWKSFTARRANALLGRRGAFWQDDFFDRFVRTEEHFARACTYVENNPVKAGLCARAEDWRWSSASKRSRIAAPYGGLEAAAPRWG